ncbi:deoxycytidylate deaminase-like isoform 2-T4 [Clarias gariepinus]|uniref:deoxycytidylate deaminase-like isoform X2 n=1 Tax=Clarias gariepinus TaxID=13013 RepID=UPI00234DC977|nr:deoxycytidylate deaminase-like isoform X2 [Clarias gariepinus]
MASARKRGRKGRKPPETIMQAAGQYNDDVYFMAVALLFANKSPDPSTKVGACIVNQDGHIVGIGYNKMPDRCNTSFPWNRKSPDRLETKYPYECHAELNAIMNKTSVDVKGCTIYSTMFPCNECAKVIIQSGITGLVYLSNKYPDKIETKAAVRLLEAAGIQPRECCVARS